jgi:hypothetical protein
VQVSGQIPFTFQVIYQEPLQPNPYHFQHTSNTLPHHSQPASNLNNGRMPEANGEATGSNFSAGENQDESAVKILRDIGKRLKNGEASADIVKSFGLPYGRATQELKAAVEMLAETEDEH